MFYNMWFVAAYYYTHVAVFDYDKRVLWGEIYRQWFKSHITTFVYAIFHLLEKHWGEPVSRIYDKRPLDRWIHDWINIKHFIQLMIR